jgi:hypothetical protein
LTVPAAPAEAATPSRCTASGTEPKKLTVAMGSILGLTTRGADVLYTSWHVYGSRGAINKVPKGGGPNSTLDTGELELHGLAVDDDGIFYTSGIRLMRLPLAGGSSTQISASFSAQVIALLGADVYGTPADYGPYDRVVKMAKKGGEETELASGKRPQTKEGPVGFSSIAVDASGIYVSDSGGDRVLSFPLAGGKPKVLASHQSKAFALQIDASNVYFNLAKDGALLSVPKAGGTPKKIASGLAPNARLALAGGDVFSVVRGDSEGAASTLARITVAGGAATKVATIAPNDSVEAITADDDCVYWAEHDSSGRSTVYAAARPK